MGLEARSGRWQDIYCTFDEGTSMGVKLFSQPGRTSSVERQESGVCQKMKYMVVGVSEHGILWGTSRCLCLRASWIRIERAGIAFDEGSVLRASNSHLRAY